MSNLVEYFSRRKEDIIKEIQHFIELETPSGNAGHIAVMVEDLATLLKALGAKVEIITTEGGPSLHAQFQSSITNSQETLFIVGHCDTVWPLGTLKRRPFEIRENRIYGPGVFDMKSGIVLVLEAIRGLKELNRQFNRPLEIFFSCDEEQGSHSTRDLIETMAKRAKAALVLEPCLPGGRVKTARKGIGQYELSVMGCSAHAGVAPEKGVSAIEELAHQTIKLHSLTDHKRGISVNVGVINGGTMSNVVAAKAFAEIDIRFWTKEQEKEIVAELESLKPILPGAEIKLTGKINRPPLERSEKIAKLYEHARILSQELGYELGEGKTGGGSDGNFIAALGIPVLDGLGPDGDGPHAEYEHVLIENLAPRTALVARLIETI
ncbi:MAG: M20 family metallopeptidase [Acidobacteria bacterium]|nr:M20 family metallopeptidase [Acidobacteriota bacterium]